MKILKHERRKVLYITNSSTHTFDLGLNFFILKVLQKMSQDSSQKSQNKFFEFQQNLYL